MSNTFLKMRFINTIRLSPSFRYLSTSTTLSKNYYDVLGVKPSAGQSQIQKAFRKKARDCHPDRFPEKAEEFKQLNQAYQVLSDRAKRKAYNDDMSFGRVPYRNEGPARDFEEILRETHGHGFEFSAQAEAAEKLRLKKEMTQRVVRRLFIQFCVVMIAVTCYNFYRAMVSEDNRNPKFLAFVDKDKLTIHQQVILEQERLYQEYLKKKKLEEAEKVKTEESK